MEFRELTQEEYDYRLRSVIVGAEGLHAHVQDVGDRRATVGWGYTLNRNNNAEIWAQAGIALTPLQQAVLERVDHAPAASKTAIALTLDRVLDEAEADRLFRASVQEYEAPAATAGMPLSDERVAIVSVTYNRGVGALRNHPIMDAVEDGDRAQAWYQLRYNCWGSRADMEGGLRKRRFAEAEVFGLYDDRQDVSVPEAVNVYRIYREHFADIDRAERGFGVTVAGEHARPNRIAQANRDYASIVETYGEVRTIEASLEPARSRLLEHLRLHYPDQAHEFTEMQFNSARIDLDRFPPVLEAESRDDADADQRGQGRAQPVRAPAAFADPFLNRMLGTIAAADDAGSNRILQELAGSAQGAAFLDSGELALSSRDAEQQPDTHAIGALYEPGVERAGQGRH